MNKVWAVAWILSALACGGNPNCDAKQLAGTCTYPSNIGQCVDFAGLSTNDATGAQNGCIIRGGSWGSAPCGSAGRLGTCTIPPNSPNSDVVCSPHGVIQIRYVAPYTAAQAQTDCGTVAGSSFTPG